MLTASAADLDITPPVGLPLMGYPDIKAPADGPASHQSENGYRPRVGAAVGTLDPLRATMLLLSDEDSMVALVSLDLAVIDARLTSRVNELIAELAPDMTVTLALMASHTHSGPDLYGYWDPVHSAHAEHLAMTLAGAIINARSELRPAVVAAGAGDISRYVINRYDHSGPVDGDAGFLALYSLDGELMSLLVIIACHALCLPAENLHYSGDWPAYLRSALQSSYPGATVLFANGAAGNINPVGFPFEAREDIVYQHRRLLNDGLPTTRGVHHARRLGRVTAAAVIAAVEAAGLPPVDRSGSANSGLAVASEQVALPLRDARGRAAFCDFMNVRPEHRADLLQAETLTSQVQALRIGDVALVTLPGEPFVEIGLAIKASAAGRCFTIGYSNSDPRYIPTDAALRTVAYETAGTPIGLGAEPLLVAAGSRCLRKVQTS